MATNKNETQTETPVKGARILKPGMLAADVVVPISGAPIVGKYGKLEIPLNLDGQRFVFPISLGNPQLDAMKFAFGEPGPAWVGCNIRVSDGRILKQVNIAPVSDAKGRPVQ